MRALAGAIVDVVVDIRRGSRTYLQWISVELSADNFRQIYVPAGYAHGICVISEFAEISINVLTTMIPKTRLRIIWNDPSIANCMADCVTAPLPERRCRPSRLRSKST